MNVKNPDALKLIEELTVAPMRLQLSIKDQMSILSSWSQWCVREVALSKNREMFYLYPQERLGPWMYVIEQIDEEHYEDEGWPHFQLLLHTRSKHLIRVRGR